MGDADAAQNMMPVAQLEELMDDALIEVDDEMSRLFAFMSFLNEKVAHVTSEIASLRRFRRCFAAFNLFVFPAILAIVVSYATFQNIAMSETVEVALDIFIKILMYLSLGIGFPLYLCTLCEAYFMKGYMEGVVARSHSSDSRTENGSGIDGSELTLADMEESLETISEFRRLRPEFRRFTNLRNRSNLQTERERNVDEVEVQQQPSQTSMTARMREMLETNEATAVAQQLEEMDELEHFEIDIEHDKNAKSVLERENIFYLSNSGTIFEAENLNISSSEIEKKDFHDLELFILNPDQDMVAEIEKNKFTHKTEEDRKQKIGKSKLLDIKNTRTPGLRNIVIERSSETDLVSIVWLKDNLNKCGLNEAILNSTQNLVAEIEKNGCIYKTVETRKQKAGKTKVLDESHMETSGLRNIVIQRVDKNDLNINDFSKDNVIKDELKGLIINGTQDLVPKIEKKEDIWEKVEHSKLETENTKLLDNANIGNLGFPNIEIERVGGEVLISKAFSKDNVSISEGKGLVLNSTEDQASKIEKNEDICETVENNKKEKMNKFLDHSNKINHGLRNIGIERVVQDDLYSRAFSRDNVNNTEIEGLTHNSAHDLVGKVEGNEDIFGTVEENKEKEEKTKRLENVSVEAVGLRNTAIENIGEGDTKCNTFPKINVNIGDADNFSQFGL